MKKFVAAIAVLLLTVGAFTVFRSLEPDDEQPDTTHLRTTETRDARNQDGNRSRVQLMRVDSIDLNNTLKKNLNNRHSIVTINHNKQAKSHYIDNQVIVNFKVNPTEKETAAIARAIDGKLVKHLDATSIFSSNSKTAPELVRYFNTRDDVQYVEPNYIVLQNQPNDYFYQEYQWNLPMIETEAGWKFSRGSENVKIAVLDTGVDLDHRDLAGRLVNGYNALLDNDQPEDDNGHGTHVAGIIAALTDNGEGVAGITWFNRIMPVKVMNAEGSGTAFDVALGIKWAADHGADVINLSLGNYQPSAVMEDAIRYAFDKDVVLIAATGNDNTEQPGYPAAYPDVLSVSAVNWDGRRADFSNYGDYVDVVAPGVEIASTFPDQQYAALSGTSMAAPHVTALAGLIRSLHPELTNTEVMEIIKGTTIDLGDTGKDRYYGNGLIDIVNALQTTYREKYPLGRISEWFGQFNR